MNSSSAVVVRREPVVIPTYEPLPPDPNPMFLERRVYQGSSGRVYPLPFYNRISEAKTSRTWDAVFIENEFIKVMVLPEIGGRIHVGEDKTNHYAFFYRQGVIKPALVGLAGPWASGGVEFNWPQHHRPATFMPVDVEIEEHADGSKTVWLGDHDPMERMKGMHGVCVHPGRALIELKARAYNRTPYVQSFLWWANVAVQVHEGYQSFFPPDVTCVADHAKRATSRFPLCEGRYYGVDYAGRARHGVPSHERPRQFVPPHCRPDHGHAGLPDYAPNDLTWYANIPVPTSYMALGSRQDFSGGYDHVRRAGLVQIADHHIAPGKKQWTWGNHEFGYAWDRNLTDNDGPYIELMLGVYTDNQPDFSFLQPGETKSWSVYWYPIREIGPAQAANVEAAVSFQSAGGKARIGVAVTQAHPDARVELWRHDALVRKWEVALAPDRPFVTQTAVPVRSEAHEWQVCVVAARRELIRCQPRRMGKSTLPAPATEPPEPGAVTSTDELFVIGLHLSQYRHATRSPVDYWREALRRDPGDARCNDAVGVWHLRRGEFPEAEGHFRTAIERLTSRNPNPSDGAPYYHLGLALRFQNRDGDAYDAFYKAIWNQAWQAAGFHALAEIDASRGDWTAALDHVDRALRVNAENLRARNLRAIVLRRLGRAAEADAQLAATLALDPLDWWARHLRGENPACDTQTRIDLALDYARAGLKREAAQLLEGARPEPYSGTGPLVQYYLASLYRALGEKGRMRQAARRAAAASPEYCFPARLEEIGILEEALAGNGREARASYYLGNLLYDRRRHAEAISAWERSARIAPRFATVWRNLGIAYFNVRHDAAKARRAYDRAFQADPTDARVFYERDQLWKRLGVPARLRLREFERHRNLVAERDDATVELCALYNQTGRPERAREILRGRTFQPWEGGEGLALGQFVRAHLLLGRAALRRGDAVGAREAFEAVLTPPENLGETWHLLANQSDVLYWLGEANAAVGRAEEARQCRRRASESRGDFQEMSVRMFSEMTYWSARAAEKLGRTAEARSLFQALLAHARERGRTVARIDYFATSLPTMLLFEDDLQARQLTTAKFLEAQARFGLRQRLPSLRLAREVLRRDPSHAGAADLVAELQSESAS